MTHRWIRPVVVAALVLMIGATTLAQRGGYRGGFNASGGNTPYDGRFVFVRMAYNDYGFRGGARWAHDYPDGESRFLKMLATITNIPTHVNESSIMSFSDPEIYKFPVIYLVEPGGWDMSDQDVKTLRAYLQKGGFLIVDDFPRGAWPNFEYQMSRVFPEGPWRDMVPKDQVFHTFFEIESLDLPIVYPQLGGYPIFRALYTDNDPKKRMLVIANFQNDISEYWEFSETAWKPISENNTAFQFGINEFLYGITH